MTFWTARARQQAAKRTFTFREAPDLRTTLASRPRGEIDAREIYH